MAQLARHLGGRLEVMNATLAVRLRTAWDSGGKVTALDAAAHDIADAFGLFFAHLLHALVADVVRQRAGLSDARKAHSEDSQC